MANGHFTMEQVNGLWWLNDPDGLRVVPHGFTMNADGTVFNPPGNYGSLPSLNKTNLWKLRDRYCFAGARLWHIHGATPHWDNNCGDGEFPGSSRGAGKSTEQGFYLNDEVGDFCAEATNQRVITVITMLVGGHGGYLNTDWGCGANYPAGGGTWKDVWLANLADLASHPQIVDNPWVFINPLVEPGSFGANNMLGDQARWISEHQWCIDRIRAAGLDNWIVVGGLEGGRDRGNPQNPGAWSAQSNLSALSNPNVFGQLNDSLGRLGRAPESYFWGGGPSRAYRVQQVKDYLDACFSFSNAPIINTDWDWGYYNGTGSGYPAPATTSDFNGWSDLQWQAEAWLDAVKTYYPNVALMQWHGNGGNGSPGGGGNNVTTTAGPNGTGDWANINATAGNLTPMIGALRTHALAEGTNHLDVVNTAPIANPFFGTTALNTPFSGQVVASDPDGHTLTYTLTTQGSCGTWFMNQSTGAFTFTPNSGYVGTCVAQYSVCDNQTPALCDTESISITVQSQPTGGERVVVML